MEALAGELETLPPSERIYLHFALAKAYEDCDEPERSFRHLCAGNALKRPSVDYDEAVILAGFDRLRAVFTPALMRDHAGRGDPTTTPVFIVGMPRSGTTLVEQILASHPRVFGAGELECFPAAVRGLIDRERAAGTFRSCCARSIPRHCARLRRPIDATPNGLRPQPLGSPTSCR